VKAARQTGEPHRVWKIRIVDVLEGKTARILAILLLIAAILILALVMSQTA
jgi:type IV secretory pathway VirB2 component (pilin)